MASALKFFACVFLTLNLSLNAQAAERWQWALSPFYAPHHSASIKGQLLFSPQGHLDGEGWIFRYDARLSRWRDRNPLALRNYVLESEDNFYAGYAFQNGPWRARLFAGPSIYSDNQFGFTVQMGAAAIAELLWLGPSGEFVGFEARGSTIKSNWGLNVVSGFPTGFGGLKLGPEAGVGGSATGWSARAGVAATGLKISNLDLAISAGAMIDDQDVVGPYVSLWLSGRF